MKAEIDRKDTTIESLKAKVAKLEADSSVFENEIKQKQSTLTKDLYDLNKRSEN